MLSSSIWYLLGRCIIDWNNTRKNREKVKITYKQMQVLRTFKKIILVGVPTDVTQRAWGACYEPLWRRRASQ